jgi:endonuclease/exonuclease/phosphatase family metal-dependent hydrolase
VRGFDADIVVVSEAWRELDGRGVLDDLVADGYQVETLNFATFEHGRLEPETLMPGVGHWELALCSRLPIIGRRDVPIGSIRNDPASPRDAIVCTVDVHGIEVDVIAVHVSSKIYKLAPVRHLRGLKPHLPPASRHAVLAGDFNFWGPGVERIFPGWRRSMRGRTYPSHRPHSQIDHILVRDDIAIVSGEVLAANPSDHRPVRARLRVSDPPGPDVAGAVG